MTPRALADDTSALLKPLSCHAIAAASEGETPCAEATDWMSPAPTRVGVGSGAAAGTTRCAGSGSEARAGAGEPDGSFSTVPVSSSPDGSRPFAAAICSSETPEFAARPDSVSPARTMYEPAGGGAPPLAPAGAGAEGAGAEGAGAEAGAADAAGAWGATPSSWTPALMSADAPSTVVGTLMVDPRTT